MKWVPFVDKAGERIYNENNNIKRGAL